MELNKKKILEYQQNRDPYLLIDHATEVIPGESAIGYKILNNDEWYFKVHWPKDPNMPGMLQIEALVQMCALAILTLPKNKGKIVYLVQANNLKFKKKVTPKKKFEINTKILTFKRGVADCEGFGTIDQEIACQANFTLILPDVIRSYNLK